MAFQITGANSRRTKVEILLPVDIDGEPVFDEDDGPVPNAEPVKLVLPRYNYIPRDQLKDLMSAAAEIDKRELTAEYTAADRNTDSTLAQLRPFVSDEVYKILCGLTWGELGEINEEWARSSNVPLGESSASNGSSKSTRRPSNMTSSAAASASAT